MSRLLPCFRLAQCLAASCESVFDAWVRPETMQRWLFLGKDNEIRKVQNDLRVGGCFSVMEWTGTEYVDHFGHYEQIDWPHRLDFSLRVPKHFPQHTHVSVMVSPHPAGCELVLLQCGVHRKTVEKPWCRMFDALALLTGDERPRSARQLQASSTE